jgi:hypothetical protein
MSVLWFVREGGVEWCARLLADRDEFRVGMHRLFYSSETLTRVQEYRGPEVVCPRCRTTRSAVRF